MEKANSRIDPLHISLWYSPLLSSIYLVVLFTLLLMSNYEIPFAIVTPRKEVSRMVAITAIKASPILPNTVFSCTLCCLYQPPQSSCYQ